MNNPFWTKRLHVGISDFPPVRVSQIETGTHLDHGSTEFDSDKISSTGDYAMEWLFGFKRHCR